MNANTFAEAVKREFAFLMDDLDFRVVKESYDPAIMGNAAVLLLSSAVVVSVVKDRGQVLINIGEASSHRDEWFEFTDVVRFFSSNATLDVYQFRANPYDVPPVENQLSRLAKLAREYCSPMLQGDFSMKDKIRALEEKRAPKPLKGLRKR